MAADKHFKTVIRTLEILEEAGHSAMMAGGCVRDRLLGVKPKDYDIATDATPPQVNALFIQKGFRVVPTGEDHGTMTVVTATGPIEITTLRKDVKTDGRKAEVAFGVTFEEDAARRDFTINAMYEDRKSHIIDYFGGANDLKRKHLRFVGDPLQRIKEDYLRILRYFRFWARFQFNADSTAIAAITAGKGGLAQISQERITNELLELLSYEYVRLPVDAMYTTGVLGVILPQAKWRKASTHAQLANCAQIEQKSRALARLGILFGGTRISRIAAEVSESLRLSKKQEHQLATLLRGKKLFTNLKKEQAQGMAMIDACERLGGKGSFLRLFFPYWNFVLSDEELAQKNTWLHYLEETKSELRQSKLPFSGKDLMVELSLRPGPQLGAVMAELLRSFRNEKWRTRTDGLTYAKEFIASTGPLIPSLADSKRSID